ncbi:hypothetical protein [Aureimonas sp. N4]|uniref:hypothetical protein n=1 Tax=Aureimonas sp. N4 TaxID=1638165 RepID=UPI0007825EB0|nr:hypothetical protein [Aureimonas sp. N4]
MIGAVRATLRKEALRRAMARALRARLAARIEEEGRAAAFAAASDTPSEPSRKINELVMAGGPVTAYYEMYQV